MTSLTVPPSAPLDRLDLLERHLGDGEPAMLAERDVDARPGAATSSSRISNSTQCARGVERLGGAPRMADRARGRLRRRHRQPGQAAQRIALPPTCAVTSGGVGGASTVRASARHRAARVPASIEPTPSTRQWCVLVASAQRPPASPSSSTMRQRGRARSSRCDQKSAAQASSSRSPPGLGSAARVTCAAMSKRSSASHYGQRRPPVVRRESRWR